MDQLLQNIMFEYSAKLYNWSNNKQKIRNPGYIDKRTIEHPNSGTSDLLKLAVESLAKPRNIFLKL